MLIVNNGPENNKHTIKSPWYNNLQPCSYGKKFTHEYKFTPVCYSKFTERVHVLFQVTLLTGEFSIITFQF